MWLGALPRGERVDLGDVVAKDVQSCQRVEGSSSLGRERDENGRKVVPSLLLLSRVWPAREGSEVSTLPARPRASLARKPRCCARDTSPLASRYARRENVPLRSASTLSLHRRAIWLTIELRPRGQEDRRVGKCDMIAGMPSDGTSLLHHGTRLQRTGMVWYDGEVCWMD